jgi:hypothetical protein
MRTPGLPASIALALLLSLTAAATARGQFGAPEALDGAPIYTVLPVDHVPGTIAFWFAWKQIYPQTAIWKPAWCHSNELELMLRRQLGCRAGWQGSQARGVLDLRGDEMTQVLARLQQRRGSCHSEREALR